MNETKLTSIASVKAFLAGTQEIQFAMKGQEGCYDHIQRTLRRFGYGNLSRGDKGVIRTYLMRTTGYSRQQITRLIERGLGKCPLTKRYTKPKAGFARKYSHQDAVLLAEIDALHQGLSGPATKHLLGRAVDVYGDQRYAQLANISVAHLYNLRNHSQVYRSKRIHFTKTKGKPTVIGIRKAPSPNGKPGYIRIDSVHQGDQDGVKGVYYINAVDCITQWEVVACCERISEAYLLPVIESMLAQFPFKILGFHADNGSEYINHQVASLLKKLNIEFTKSRPRHSNDNGLVETKNGAVIRKTFGYDHIQQKYAAPINDFCKTQLTAYINYHRPCSFAKEKRNKKGKVVRTYPQKLVMTPFEKLQRIPKIEKHFKKGVSLSLLAQEAQRKTDSQAAAEMNQAQRKLFDFINRSTKHRTA